ncbi:HNH endonuclease [Chryseobacterium sp. SIMBA_029]|uniref:HNH endonuclease n=1 Tax=Chryseobacterium sp. SIMBA_029 TaxID=3085772 RepID=UPI003979A2B3
MHKINYPTNSSKLENLKKEFQNFILKSSKIDILEIQIFLNSIGVKLPFKEIIIMPLEDLIKLTPLSKTNIFDGLSKKQKKAKKEELKSYFNYSKFQQDEFSKFFNKYSTSLDITGCNYCGIDFINAYIPLDNDYRDFEHFMNECTKEDLMKIYGIKSSKADIIIKDYKGKILKYSDIDIGHSDFINKTLHKLTDKSGVIKFDIFKTEKKNHFTLDHLLPQSEYPYLSLSLFNLVPSCYSCNSKLKNDKKIYSNLDELLFTSPTGLKTISDIIFKIYFKTGFDDKNLPKELNEYSVKIESPYTEYFKVFNLQGRYNFHKNISHELISKRRIYSDSQIKEIFNLLNVKGKSISENEIKNQIFGSDIFTEDRNKPFQKYKKDIAKQLKIIPL